jgi:HPt (histidine-containing phosphotransfer) domain-containing protein
MGKNYTDLSYLKSVTNNETSIIREMIELFINQIPEFITNMNKYLNEKKYIELGKEAHKAKSSLLVIGMEELATDMKTLQLATLESKDTDTYPGYVKKFDEQCNKAIEELKVELGENSVVN